MMYHNFIKCNSLGLTYTNDKWTVLYLMFAMNMQDYKLQMDVKVSVWPGTKKNKQTYP